MAQPTLQDFQTWAHRLSGGRFTPATDLRGLTWGKFGEWSVWGYNPAVDAWHIACRYDNPSNLPLRLWTGVEVCQAVLDDDGFAC